MRPQHYFPEALAEALTEALPEVLTEAPQQPHRWLNSAASPLGDGRRGVGSLATLILPPSSYMVALRENIARNKQQTQQDEYL